MAVDTLDTVAREVAFARELGCTIGPTVPIVAPPLARAQHLDTIVALVSNTCLANLTGLPALSLPVPGEGLPVGLQVMATANERTLAVAAAIEERLAAG